MVMSMACSSDNAGTDDMAMDDPQQPTPQDLQAETIRDVSYGDDDEQVYDIHLPEGRTAQDSKVILLIHGGAWTAGDKADMDYFLPILQPQLENYAIVNMNYILANETTPAFPNQINDVGRVIDHVTGLASSYEIDPTFGIIGVSAGAQLGLQYAYTQNEDSAITMACSVVGPVDFTDSYYQDNSQFQFVEDLVDEDAYPPNTDYETVLSPALNVTSTSVPTILFYGESDPLVPQSQANAINDALAEENIVHDLTIYEGGHADWSFASYIDLQAKLVQFVQTHL